MEFLTATYDLFSIAAVGVLALALLAARFITPRERLLITAAAAVLGGVFYLGGSHDSLVPLLVGVAIWGLGTAAFVREGIAWRRADASRVGPLATALLLPPAFFGVVLVAGLATSVLEGAGAVVLAMVG